MNQISDYSVRFMCYSYHEGLKKWVEVGNSGMFRPEMLQPMGLPEDVSVIIFIRSQQFFIS
jgi:phenylalanyl-tRNA synthetase alpha subunit